MVNKDLNDEELVDIIVEHLKEDDRVHADFVDIDCVDGKPILAGRVGSDEELQVIDEIMTDVLEFPSYESTIWVDDSLAFEGTEEEGSPAEVNFDSEEDEMDADASFEEDEDE